MQTLSRADLRAPDKDFSAFTATVFLEGSSKDERCVQRASLGFVSGFNFAKRSALRAQLRGVQPTFFGKLYFE